MLKIRKYIYTEPTLVLTRVCQPWVMHHADIPITLPELPSPIDFFQDSYKIQPLVLVSSPIFNTYPVLAKIFKIWFLEFFLFLKWKTRHINSH